MEQFPRSNSRSSRHSSDQQAPHERSRASRQTSEPRQAADPHRASANKGAHASSATKEQVPARPKSRYIPALDGLRTLAVVAVVLYHLNLTWAQGGLLGVTIFFVLSGYLITRLLINEVSKTGRIDLKSFWIRRIRRLVRRGDRCGCNLCAVHRLQPRDAHQDASRHSAVAAVL